MSEFDLVLNTLAEGILVGRHHLWIWWILSLVLNRKPEVLNKFPVFLGLTLKAHVDEAILTLARLYDKPKGTVTLRLLIELAENNAGRFKGSSPEKVRSLLRDIKAEVCDIEKEVEMVKDIRDKLIAHLSIKSLQAPGSASMATLNSMVKNRMKTWKSMDRLFKRVEQLLNRISKAYRGVGIPDFESSNPPGCAENTEISKLFG